MEMTHKLYVVRDVKSDSYGSIIVCPSKGIAMRSFQDAVEAEGPMKKYPADFSLYEIGTYDSRSGVVKGYDVPQYVCSASDMSLMQAPEVVNGTR